MSVERMMISLRTTGVFRLSIVPTPPRTPRKASNLNSPHATSSFQFLLEPFAEPLFDHALVIQIPRAGDAFEAGEQTRVEAQRDGRALAIVGAEERLVHESAINARLHPEGGFVFLGLETGDLAPCGDGLHAGREVES